MSKRWSIEDDEFIVRFFDEMGDYIGPHDLGRPKGAAAKRARHLKETGAWDALRRRMRSDFVCLRDYFEALGVRSQEREDLMVFHPGADMKDAPALITLVAPAK
jgi:hypothetical protein